MTAVLATPISQIELIPGSAIRISGLTWEGYVALLQELGDARLTRIAYENGMLEIRMPGQPHESVNRVLATIAVYVDALISCAFPAVTAEQLNQWLDMR
jgi:Uma2 family endonuclease